MTRIGWSNWTAVGITIAASVAGLVLLGRNADAITGQLSAFGGDRIPVDRSGLISAIANVSEFAAACNIEVRRLDAEMVVLECIHRDGPMNAAEAKVIALGFVNIAIRTLIAAGYNPREHHLPIVAAARASAGVSVTGAPVFRQFDAGVYDPDSDRVRYVPIGVE